MQKTKDEKILILLKVIFVLEILFIPIIILIYFFENADVSDSTYCSMAVCENSDYTNCKAYDESNELIWSGNCDRYYEHENNTRQK